MLLKSDTTTTVGAVGALTSPWWLPHLHHVSVVAAELAPILGALWLVIKIGHWFYEQYQKRKFRNELHKRLFHNKDGDN